MLAIHTSFCRYCNEITFIKCNLMVIRFWVTGYCTRHLVTGHYSIMYHNEQKFKKKHLL